MSEIIEQMQSEHANMSKVLLLLGQQLRILDEGGSADFTLMQDIVDYIMNYSDRVHHPKEDLIYKKLDTTHKELHETLEDLLHDHRDLANKTSQFANTLSEIILDAIIPRNAVVQQGREFIDANLQHIRREESIVFPLASQSLQQKDWTDIKKSMADKNDPLSGNVAQKQYQTLYNRIMDLKVKV